MLPGGASPLLPGARIRSARSAERKPLNLKGLSNAMAFQAVPNVAQARLRGVVDGQLTINDLYFEVSGGGITVTNLTTLCSALSDWFANNMAPLLSEDWTAVDVQAFDLGSATGPSVIIGAATPGAIASEACPNNVAACISIRTAQRGRSGRGRNFIPGVPGNAVTLNTLSSPFMIAMIEAYTLLVGPGSFEAGWQLVVVSRVTAGAPRAVGIAIPVVSVAFTSPYVRSMRSREVGHGA